MKEGDPVSTDMVADGFRITGFTHIHPGDWVGYSGTDKDTFVENPGIHLIVSRDGAKVGVHCSVLGACWTLDGGRPINQEVPEGFTILIYQSGNKPLEELLHEKTWTRWPEVTIGRRHDQWSREDYERWCRSHNGLVIDKHFPDADDDRLLNQWARRGGNLWDGVDSLVPADNAAEGLKAEDVVVAFCQDDQCFKIYPRTREGVLETEGLVDHMLTADLVDLLEDADLERLVAEDDASEEGFHE